MAKLRSDTFKTAAVFAGFLWFIPLAQGAQVRTVNCDDGQTIAKALRYLKPGGTVVVSGTCNENVEVPAEVQRITLDGQGTATINGPDAAEATVKIRGTDVTVKGFTITGGLFGIHLTDGGNATVDGNVIQLSARDGVQVSRNSSAIIVNNTIQNHPRNGIGVGESSSARIGFRGPRGNRTAEPNVIASNGGRGIQVTRSSSARIYGNTISNNGSRGVEVDRASHADISSNDIDNNGSHGILVNQNSAVVLGADTTDDPLADDPNRTTVNNGGRGIRCANNSLADGRLGTLNGNGGPTNFDGSCVNSLLP